MAAKLSQAALKRTTVPGVSDMLKTAGVVGALSFHASLRLGPQEINRHAPTDAIFEYVTSQMLALPFVTNYMLNRYKVELWFFVRVLGLIVRTSDAGLEKYVRVYYMADCAPEVVSEASVQLTVLGMQFLAEEWRDVKTEFNFTWPRKGRNGKIIAPSLVTGPFYFIHNPEKNNPVTYGHYVYYMDFYPPVLPKVKAKGKKVIRGSK